MVLMVLKQLMSLCKFIILYINIFCITFKLFFIFFNMLKEEFGDFADEPTSTMEYLEMKIEDTFFLIKINI